MGRKRVLVILGNGFSIDLMHWLKCDNVVNLTNLFALGEKVKWPGTNKPGFLSYQYCKNLWTLGAQPSISSEEANELIESIISCANILSQKGGIENKIYIKAYKELEYYLVSLFLLYTQEMKVPSKTKDVFSDWGWYKFFTSLNASLEIEHVDIITLNYDVWLEQLLKIWEIPFSIESFQDDNKKFKIYKPHGSIGFQSKVRVDDRAAFDIKFTRDGFDNLNTEDFYCDVENIDGLNSVNAIIPPAGDSNRLVFNWAKDQRNAAVNASKRVTEEDLVVLCGISYWHVDRAEIDNYLTSTPSNVEVVMVNPNPPKDLEAVLMTLYDNFRVFSNSDNLINI